MSHVPPCSHPAWHPYLGQEGQESPGGWAQVAEHQVVEHWAAGNQVVGYQMAEHLVMGNQVVGYQVAGYQVAGYQMVGHQVVGYQVASCGR